jgi:hypothetical protein
MSIFKVLKMENVCVVDLEGLEYLKDKKILIDYERITSNIAISYKYYKAYVKGSIENVKTYKPLAITIDKDTYFNKLNIILKFVEYIVKEKDITTDIISNTYLNKIKVYFYIKSIPVFVNSKEEFKEKEILHVSNIFSVYDEYLCVDNMAVVEQIPIIYPSIKITNYNKFYYFDRRGMSNDDLKFIKEFTELFKGKVITEVSNDVLEKLELKGYGLLTKENISKLKGFRLFPEVLYEGMNNKKEKQFFELTEEDEINIDRINIGKNPIFKYEKEIEFPLLENLIEERHKNGDMDDDIHTVINVEEGKVTCPSSKEFFKALKKAKITNHKKYHTLDFEDACAFRIKLTERKIRSIIVPVGSSNEDIIKGAEDGKETHPIPFHTQGYYVYYRSDYEVSSADEDDKKRFTASLIQVYKMKKDKSLRELFTLKLINGKEVKDDASILGYFSDHHTLGLKD